MAGMTALADVSRELTKLEDKVLALTVTCPECEYPLWDLEAIKNEILDSREGRI